MDYIFSKYAWLRAIFVVFLCTINGINLTWINNALVGVGDGLNNIIIYELIKKILGFDINHWKINITA